MFKGMKAAVVNFSGNIFNSGFVHDYSNGTLTIAVNGGLKTPGVVRQRTKRRQPKVIWVVVEDRNVFAYTTKEAAEFFSPLKDAVESHLKYIKLKDAS